MSMIFSVICGLRWMRVSQREHYLSWSAFSTARRWFVSLPVARGLAVLWGFLSLGAALLTLGGRAPAAASTGLVAAAVATIYPARMPLVGKPRLRLTRRAVTQFIISGVVFLLFELTLYLAGLLGLAMAIGPPAFVIAIDLGALANRPLEDRRAKGYRVKASRRLSAVDPRMVAITGSFGKTTVKGHLNDLLSESFSTVATPGSWNNMAGISRAINEYLTADAEVFIAEVGTYGVGEIRDVVSWLRPEIVGITGVGPVHLERMGDISTIVRAKSEILQDARVAVICVDSDELDELARAALGEGRVKRLLTAASNPMRVGSDVMTVVCSAGEGSVEQIAVRVGGREICRVDRQQLHASNVATAVALALAVGLSEEAIAASIVKLGPATSRATMSVSSRGVRVLDDTFNSNPAGAQAALESLCRSVPAARRVVVTPGMVELGALQASANAAFALAVSSSQCELVIVGWTNRLALLTGFPGAHLAANRENARQWVLDNLSEGDIVLWENDLPDHYP
ncbi:MAG: Mur ligase family protein [Actinomycetota bacterium]